MRVEIDRAIEAPLATLRESAVELLGVLVPGLLVTLLMLLAAGWPAWALARVIQDPMPADAQVADQLARFAQAARFELVILLLVGGYVCGHFLFRQDPKIPDGRSFRCVAPHLSAQDRETWVVQADESGATDIQFPYRFLFEYLDARGLRHLAKIVPWKGRDVASHKFRTKSFVNILKIRLAFHFPERYGTIMRNEAHVRLMSSVWYGAGLVIRASALGLVLCLVGAGWIALDPEPLRWPRLVAPALCSLAMLALGLLARRTIERFFHYQRVREVIYVLETAFIASRQLPSILEGLC